MNRIQFPSLMDQMISYGEGKSVILKVTRIYALCIQKGKLELANKIKKKYPQYFKDDLISAMTYALWATKIT